MVERPPAVWKASSVPIGSAKGTGSSLAQRLDGGALAVAEDPRGGGVVVERPLQRVDDLVVERRLRVLGESADVDSYPVGAIEAADPLGGEDVDHPRREAAIGHDREPLGMGLGLELLLLHDDLGVSAEVGEMAAALDRERAPSDR